MGWQGWEGDVLIVAALLRGDRAFPSRMRPRWNRKVGYNIYVGNGIARYAHDKTRGRRRAEAFSWSFGSGNVLASRPSSYERETG